MSVNKRLAPFELGEIKTIYEALNYYRMAYIEHGLQPSVYVEKLLGEFKEQATKGGVF